MFGRRRNQELERLRELASMKLSYTVAGQTILGPVTFEELAAMASYGHEGDMRLHEQVARGVWITHRVWNPRYGNVTGKPVEKP